MTQQTRRRATHAGGLSRRANRAAQLTSSHVSRVGAFRLALPPAGNILLARPRLPKEATEEIRVEALPEHEEGRANLSRQRQARARKQAKDGAASLGVPLEAVHRR